MILTMNHKFYLCNGRKEGKYQWNILLIDEKTLAVQRNRSNQNHIDVFLKKNKYIIKKIVTIIILSKIYFFNLNFILEIDKILSILSTYTLNIFLMEDNIKGLKNSGNMCFLNVIIQALSNLVSVKQFFFSTNNHNHEMNDDEYIEEIINFQDFENIKGKYKI